MKKIITFVLSLVFYSCTVGQKSKSKLNANNAIQALHNNTIIIPTLLVNNESTHEIAKAYRIAIGDISGNIQYHKSGVLKQPEPTLYAGLRYGKPWTRDAAINVWNGFGLLSPDVAKNTLLAQIGLNEKEENVIIGQYWDKIIWTIGAWNYYLYTGDRVFLKDAYTVVQNTLRQLERDEFNSKIGLFRGPAVYGDGVAAYPEIYTNHQEEGKNGTFSGIYQWAAFNDDLKHKIGYGMPMYTLSTNAVYYRAYKLLTMIAKELNEEPSQKWKAQAKKLKTAINHNFWSDKKNNYTYLIDPFGNSDAQESLGIAFCLLFDIADKTNIDAIFKSTFVEPAGIPCIYPTFNRYRNLELDSYGRHSGTVWPHIQGFWADAAIKYNKPEKFLHEFYALTRHALRDSRFVEIYHPTKEIPYGGIQEPTLKEWEEWFCVDRQTWSATAYLSMIFKNIIGMNFSEQGIKFEPYLPDTIDNISLLGLKYRNGILNIHIYKSDSNADSFSINGKMINQFFLPSDVKGNLNIEIKLGMN